MQSTHLMCLFKHKRAVLKSIAAVFFAAFFIISAVAQAADLPITSEFGWRNDPYTGEWKFHSGLDLGYEYGTEVTSIFDGEVIYAGNLDDGYGNQVVIYSSSYDAYTRFAHLSEYYVITGQMVYAGEPIAAVGSTGRSTGPHLHLEYIISGDDGYHYENPIVLWQ